MEIENNDSQEVPPSNVPQQANQNPILNQNGIFPLVIGTVFMVIIVGIGLYYFNSNQSLSINKNQSRSTASTPSAITVANWNAYTHPSGDYSFQYPTEVELVKLNEGVNERIILDFRSGDSFGNHTRLDIYLSTNSYHRPLSEYLTTDLQYQPEQIKNAEQSRIGDLLAIRLQDKSYDRNDEYVYVDAGETVYRIRLENRGEIAKNLATFNQILATFKIKRHDVTNGTQEVKVINGDIVVVNNGKEVKITSYGHNSDPVLSPDKTKIAFLSTSKETLEYAKVDQGYKRFSENVWIINRDGSNPVQVTKHKDFVVRSHLHWLDNGRLLFLDGEETARLYTLSKRTLERIFGPEQPVWVCLDACSFFMYKSYSPDRTYLVSMSVGYGDRIIRVANTKTLKSFELENPYSPCVNSESIKFSSDNKTLIFSSNTDERTCSDGKNIEVDLNLETQKISTK